MKRVRLLVERHYPAGWVFSYPPHKVGETVEVVPARNIPGEGNYWIENELLKNDPYGILLIPGDYEELPDE